MLGFQTTRLNFDLQGVSGVVCGVLLSQVIVEKGGGILGRGFSQPGDAEVDGGMEAFRKNQELAGPLNIGFLMVSGIFGT